MLLRVYTGILGGLILTVASAVSLVPDGVIYGQLSKNLLPRASKARIRGRQVVEGGLNPVLDSTRDPEFIVTHTLNLAIGTPPKTVPVAVDTASGDFWIQAKDYGKCVWNFGDCLGPTNYTVSGSRSALRIRNDTITKGYAAGQVSADIYNETIRVGNQTLQNFPLGIATENSVGISILGLGPPQDATQINGRGSEVLPTFLEVLKKQGLIASRAFSLFPNGKDTGSIIFGGVDQSVYEEPLQAMPLLNDTRVRQVAYCVNLNSLSLADSADVGNYSISNASQSYIAWDSAASYSYFPNELLVPVYKRLGVLYDVRYGQWNIDCGQKGSNATLTFNIGPPSSKFRINVPVKSLIYTQNDRCLFTVLGGPGGTDYPFVQIGDNILSQFYSVFDHEDGRMAIASLKNGGTGASAATPNIQPILPGQGIPGAVYG